MLPKEIDSDSLDKESLFFCVYILSIFYKNNVDREKIKEILKEKEIPSNMELYFVSNRDIYIANGKPFFVFSDPIVEFVYSWIADKDKILNELQTKFLRINSGRKAYSMLMANWHVLTYNELYENIKNLYYGLAHNELHPTQYIQAIYLLKRNPNVSEMLEITDDFESLSDKLINFSMSYDYKTWKNDIKLYQEELDRREVSNIDSDEKICIFQWERNITKSLLEIAEEKSEKEYIDKFIKALNNEENNKFYLWVNDIRPKDNEFLQFLVEKADMEDFLTKAENITLQNLIILFYPENNNIRKSSENLNRLEQLGILIKKVASSDELGEDIFRKGTLNELFCSTQDLINNFKSDK